MHVRKRVTQDRKFGSKHQQQNLGLILNPESLRPSWSNYKTHTYRIWIRLIVWRWLSSPQFCHWWWGYESHDQHFTIPLTSSWNPTNWVTLDETGKQKVFKLMSYWTYPFIITTEIKSSGCTAQVRVRLNNLNPTLNTFSMGMIPSISLLSFLFFVD